jgi:hypothetical protein
LGLFNSLLPLKKSAELAPYIDIIAYFEVKIKRNLPFLAMFKPILIFLGWGKGAMRNINQPSLYQSG